MIQFRRVLRAFKKQKSIIRKTLAVKRYGAGKPDFIDEAMMISGAWRPGPYGSQGRLKS
jgi:hypothetical protein